MLDTLTERIGGNMTSLINENGLIEFGVYETPPNLVNYLDFDLRNNMDNPVAQWRKKMRFNQFQFISATGEDFILGAAIVNLKWISNCFVYLYQPSTHTFKEYSWLQPFAFNTQTDELPMSGHWQFKKGSNLVAMSCENHLRNLTIKIKNELVVNITLDEKQPSLDVCCRAGYTGWVYTHKNAALSVKGNIIWQGENIDVNKLKGSVDWSCGFMRRETFWNWASLSHTTQEGNVIGFNLAAGVNETSFTENNVWINGESIKLDRAEFAFNRDDRMQTWSIKSSDQRIQLTFTPMGERKEKINAGFIASNFTQVFGTFNGTVIDNTGNAIPIHNALGFCEDHFAKW